MLPEPEKRRYLNPDRLTGHHGPVIDVRTPDAFDECHLPGSVNRCVYEIAFMKELPEAIPDKSTPIVVYGEGDPFNADLAAFGRLLALGYNNVFILEGGLARWKSSGRPTEGAGAQPSETPTGRFELDTQRTRVLWVGRNLKSRHDGEVKATSGYIEIGESGRPVGGRVVVDMRQLSCRDIEDRSTAAQLIAHLKDADFFDVKNFPEASFSLRSIQPIAGATYGRPNYRIKGALEARGKEAALEVDALIESIEKGYVFQSSFSFDRIAIGACYGSGRLFERLGMHLVNDLVNLDVTAFFTTQRGS